MKFDNRRGGAGESRTPVQTYPPKAFYMLIPALFVGNQPGQDKPTNPVSALFSPGQHSDQPGYPVFSLIRRRSLATGRPASSDIMYANSMN